MANNKIQVKRTNVAGRTANVTNAGNTQYIDAGEFALNMADQILYTSNGSTLITVGANLVNQRITNSVSIDNNKNIRFQTVNTAAYVGMRQQNDDNFVFYSTNTAYGERAIWSVFANSITSAFSVSSPTIFNANVNLGQVALTVNNSTGSAGQVLTTNGSSTYWSTVSGSGTVNVNAQYVWTNLHTFQANISFTGNNISFVTNTGSILFAGSADQNWKIGRNTGSPTKFFYTNNTLDIVAAGSNLEGFVIGQPGANTYLETGYAGTFTRLPVYVGNSTQNVTTTNTAINLQSNTTVNATVNSSTLQVSNSTATSNLTAQGLSAGANVVANTTAFRVGNTTLTTTNAVFGGTIAANGGIGSAGQVLMSAAGANAYWSTIGNGTVTSVASGNGITGGTITSTGTLYAVGGVGTVVNTGGVNVLANNGIVANSTGTFVNATYIATIAANSATGSLTNTFTVGTASYFVANGNLGVGTSTPATKLTVNPKVSDDNSANYDSNTVYFTHQSPTGTAILNDPKPVLLLARQGTSGQAYGAAAEFNLSRYENASVNSRTRLDIRLADGSFLTNNTTVLTALSNGNIGIGNTAPAFKLRVEGTTSLAGAVSGITTLAAGNTTITGFVNATTTGQFGGNVAIAGIATLSANVVLGTTTITANGGVGTAGHVLTSGATGNVYWAAAAGGGYYKGGTSAVGSLAVGGQNLFRVNANTLNTSTTFVAGENAQATGPIAVADGITLTVQSGARVSIV